MRTQSSNEAKPEVRREPGETAYKPRPPAPEEDVEQFRRLFDQRNAQAGQGRDPHAAAMQMDQGEGDKGRTDFVPAEAAALLQSHRLVFDAPATAALPPPPAAGLADLIEKHVRQLLVSDSARSGGRDARIMLRLSDGILPGTDLTLTRGEKGWELRADVMSAAARDALEECAPDLARRFGASGLGEIHFETVLHG
jgi:hypothetical protein